MSNILGLKLYDDFVHIDAACNRVSGFHGSYRPLVYDLTCLVGGSVTASKVASILLLVLSAVLWIYWILPKAESNTLLDRIGRFLLFLHPVAVFPVFYASQISMAITWFWTTAGLAVIRRWNSWAISLPFWIVWAFVGTQVRIENIYILLYCWMACIAFDFIFSKARPQWREVASVAIALIGTFLWEGIGKLYFLNFSAWIPPSNLAPAALDYPRESFFAIQSYAQFIYLKNLAWPMDMSFFGPWLKWWEIHSTQNTSFEFAFIALAVLLAAITFFKKSPKAIRMISFAILCAALSAAIQSIPRVPDWYFISRQTIPVALAMGIVGMVPIRPTYTFLMGLGVACTSVFHLLFHFATVQHFLDYESRVSELSPAYHLKLASYLFEENKFEEAKLEFYHTYKMIPKESPFQSTTSSQYISLALFGGISASIAEKDLASAESAGKALWQLQNDYSIYSCLLLKQHQIEIQPDCFPKGRDYQMSFCRRSLQSLFYHYTGKGTLRPISELILSYCRSLPK